MAKTMIKVERMWDSYDVRNLCVRNRYYTRGDNDEYGRMLLFVSNHKPTKENIFRVAEDIFNHSNINPEEYGLTKDDSIAAIMFDLSRSCVTEHFTIERA